MKKIEVAAWRGYNKGDKIQGIGIKHLTKFNYSKEKRNEIIDKILDAGNEMTARKKIVKYFSDVVKEQEKAVDPFLELAKEMLSVDLRENKPDDTPVYACNSKKITIGDCKKLIKTFER